MQFPTRYVKLEAARARHGERVERLGRLFWVSDPLADAVVDALAPLPRAEREALINRALEEGIDAVSAAPEALRALFAELDHVPFWADFSRMDRGGQAFLKAGFLGGMVLGTLSLVAGYCSPAGNKPLMFSGRLEYDAQRRLAETSRFVHAVSVKGGLRRESEGFRATVKVRLMHASVRRILQKDPRWKEDAWGLPINQADMSGTAMLFSLVVIEGLERLGYEMPAAEREDFLHLWRYAAYLLGVCEELRCATEVEARTLWDLLSSTQEPPDEDSKVLALALMESGVRSARDATERARAERMRPVGYAVSRYLLGDEFADRLGYPPSSGAKVLPFVRALHRRAGPLLRGFSFGPTGRAERGEDYWSMVTRMALRGVPATFEMPERLGK